MASPKIDGLPMFAVRPSAIDRLLGFENQLTPRQMSLLRKFRVLNFSRQAQLLHGMRPDGIIPARSIEALYDEQVLEDARKKPPSGALRDTTESDLA